MFSIHNAETWTSVPKSILNIVNPLHFVIIMHFLSKVLYTCPKGANKEYLFHSHDLNVWFRGDIVKRNLDAGLSLGG